MVLRVGFVSTANIGRKNCLAIRAANDVELVAVSSRSLDKAKEWAQAWGVPKFYGSHDELFADPEVDAVYIPLPTGIRVPIVIDAAKSGKHVLCEKPIAPNSEEASKMIAACRDQGVVFMDGVMFMHNPRLVAMKKVMESEAFGQVKRVCSDFSFNGDDEFKESNIRGNLLGPALEPLGSLGDLGWYNIRLAMFAFDWALPAQVTAVAHTSKDGMPIDLSCTLSFGDGRSSTFSNSFEAAFRQHAAIVGTKQTIELSDFVIPGSASCSFRVYRKHGLTTYDMEPQSEVVDEEVKCAVSQETSMWQSFAELCRSKDAKQIHFYADLALNTQRVVDAVMASVASGGAAVTVPGSQKRKASEI